MKKNVKILFVLLILSFSATVDLPGHLYIGGNTLSALLTVAYMLITWGLWLLLPFISRRTIKVILPFLAYLTWGLISFVWYQLNTVGIQNLTVIATFIGLIILLSQIIHHHPDFTPLLIKWFLITVWAATIIYGFSMILHGPGTNAIISARSYALYALIGLSLHLAKWRNGSKRDFWAALIITAVIATSFSRMGLVIAALLFPLARFRLKSINSWIMTAGIGLFASLIFIIIISNVSAIRNRFFEGDPSFTIGGIAINAMGRTKFWKTTIDSFVQSPLIGKGAGSASALISRTYPGIEHPHNDYLRILHDFGIIGFLFWIWGYSQLILMNWKTWEKAKKIGDPYNYMFHAALLAFLAIGISMITDNTMVYITVMAPLGILSGASFRRVSFEKASRTANQFSTSLSYPSAESSQAASK